MEISEEWQTGRTHICLDEDECLSMFGQSLKYTFKEGILLNLAN
jgi:hypothetical protein